MSVPPVLFAATILPALNSQRCAVMTDMKRRASSSRSQVPSDCEGGEKRQRITDFFSGKGGEKRVCLDSLKLGSAPEAAIQKLESGDSRFRELELDQHGSFLSYYPSLAAAESGFPLEKVKALKQQLLLEPGSPKTLLPWSQGRVFVYGKEHTEKRFTCFFADATNKTYSYSGRKDLVVHSWTDSSVCPPLLRELRDHIGSLCGCQFDTALLNYYRNGEDCIGWHADDEAIYGGKSDVKSIVGVSFGAERQFQVRPKPSKKTPPQPISEQRDKLSITLKGEGSVIVMGGAMQQHWQHCVPPRKRVNSPRVSVTFRRVPLVSGDSDL